MKKFRYYLYGVRFLVEIDARTLVHQLNQPTSDLPGTVVGRWIAYIRLFDFEIRQVAGTKHKGPGALSRRPGMEEELRKLREGTEEAVERLEEFMDSELGTMCGEFCMNSFHSFVCFPLFTGARVMDGDTETGGFSFVFKKADYAEDEGLQQAGEYLAGMRRPKGMGDAEFRRLKRFAVKFILREGVLYRRGKAGMPPRRVLVSGEEK